MQIHQSAWVTLATKINTGLESRLALWKPGNEQVCVPRHNHLGGALFLSWGPTWDESSTTGSMVGSGSPGICSLYPPGARF